MKLPQQERASVPREKIVNYLLSATHRDGRSKAAYFTRFGFSASDWEVLAAALKRHAIEYEVTRAEDSPFGRRYIIEGVLPAPDGRAPLIRTVSVDPNLAERGENSIFSINRGQPRKLTQAQA